MNYQEILEKLNNDEIVNIKVWSFYGKSMACADGCCDMSFDTAEEAAEMAEYYNNLGN